MIALKTAVSIQNSLPEFVTYFVPGLAPDPTDPPAGETPPKVDKALDNIEGTATELGARIVWIIAIGLIVWGVRPTKRKYLGFGLLAVLVAVMIPRLDIVRDIFDDTFVSWFG